MTGKLSKNFHGVGIGPLSKIYAVKGLTPWTKKQIQLMSDVLLDQPEKLESL